MKKKLMVIFIALSLCLSLAACGNNEKLSYKTFTVTFDAGQGTLIESEVSVIEGKELSLKPYLPQRDNFVFTGWTDEQNIKYSLDGKIVVSSDKNLSANWEAEAEASSYNVTFELSGGQMENKSAVTVKRNGQINLAEYAPSRRGFSLTGWKDGSGANYAKDAKITVIFNMTVIAVWQAEYSEVTDFTFMLSEEKDFYILTGLAEGKNPETVVVPREYDNKPIREVAAEAFKGSQSLKAFIAEDNITDIGAHIFDGCPVLEEVVMPYVVNNEGTKAEGYDTFAVLFEKTTFGGSAPEGFVRGQNWSSEGNSYYLYPVTFTKATITGGKLWGGDFRGCSSIKELILDSKDLTEIPQYAIQELPELQKLSLSGCENLEYIRNQSCRGNKNLKAIDFSDLKKLRVIEDDAFDASFLGINESLDQLQFKNCVSLESIGADAFSTFKALKVLDLSDCDRLKSLGENAFSHCVALETVYLPANLQLPKDTAKFSVFMDCNNIKNIFVDKNSLFMTVKDGVLYDYSMSNLLKFPSNESIQSFKVPATVESISYYAFEGTKLKSLDLSACKIAAIDGLCANMKSLTEIVLPEDLTEIGESAFLGCESLSVIDLTGIERIGKSAFENTGFVSITIPDSVTDMGAYIFKDCAKLTSVRLPSGITTIPESIFQNCTALETFAIPEGVTDTSWSSFEGCSALKSVTVPEGFTAFGNSAFKDCISLEAINIPESLVTINNKAFGGCTSLTEIILNENIKTIGTSAFADCLKLTLKCSFDSAGKINGGDKTVRLSAGWNTGVQSTLYYGEWSKN